MSEGYSPLSYLADDAAKKADADTQRKKMAAAQGLDEYVTGYKAFGEKFSKSIKMRNGAVIIFYTASKDEKNSTEKAVSIAAEAEKNRAGWTAQASRDNERTLRLDSIKKQKDTFSWLGEKETQFQAPKSIKIRNGAVLVAYNSEKEKESAEDSRINDERHVRDLKKWFNSGDSLFGEGSSYFGTWSGMAYSGYDEVKLRQTLFDQFGAASGKYTSGELRKAVYEFTQEKARVRANDGWVAIWDNNLVNENINNIKGWTF